MGDRTGGAPRSLSPEMSFLNNPRGTRNLRSWVVGDDNDSGRVCLEMIHLVCCWWELVHCEVRPCYSACMVFPLKSLHLWKTKLYPNLREGLFIPLLYTAASNLYMWLLQLWVQQHVKCSSYWEIRLNQLPFFVGLLGRITVSILG